MRAANLNSVIEEAVNIDAQTPSKVTANIRDIIIKYVHVFHRFHWWFCISIAFFDELREKNDFILIYVWFCNVKWQFFSIYFLLICFSSFTQNHLSLFYQSYRSTTIRLSDTINDANDWALEDNAIHQAQTLLLKLEITEDLIHDTATVLQCLPVRTQSVYVQNVHRLERTLCRSEIFHVSQLQISISRALVKR